MLAIGFFMSSCLVVYAALAVVAASPWMAQTGRPPSRAATAPPAQLPPAPAQLQQQRNVALRTAISSNPRLTNADRTITMADVRREQANALPTPNVGVDGTLALDAEATRAVETLREAGSTMVVREGTRDLGAIGLNDTHRLGDSVTIAPAVAASSVGVAIGAASLDVALEIADIATMADRLQNLPFAVGPSRHSRSFILQNLVVGLGVVALLVPATGIGPAAVVVHEGSVRIVVFDALTILASKNGVA